MGELFELGARAKDKVTGFAGVVTACVENMYGGLLYKIESLGEDNKVIEQWFYHGRLEALPD